MMGEEAKIQTNSSKSLVEGCTRGQGQSALKLSKKPAGKHKQRLPTGPRERQRRLNEAEEGC